VILMCGVSALLYIHRCFYAHAIETHPADPMKSQYGPSFSAGYNSACTILRSVTKQFMLFPRQIVRFWVLWTHGFSATVSTVWSSCEFWFLRMVPLQSHLVLTPVLYHLPSCLYSTSTFPVLISDSSSVVWIY